MAEAERQNPAHPIAGILAANAAAEPLNREPGFSGVDVPAEADLYRCVHCGLCLSSCPTYATLRVETESPRGRIALMRAVHEGRVGISDRIVSHWEMCLQCRACEEVCPSGVPYGRIMEYSRAQVLAQGKQGDSLRRIDRLLLRAALPHPRRLRFGARLLRLYQRSGLRRLVRATGLLPRLAPALAEMERQLPDLSRRFFGPSRRFYPAQSRPEGDKAAAAGTSGKPLTVGLLAGCVMPLMQGDTMRAAVRVLTRNGCNVFVPPGQGCCGALNLHAGDLELARRMARRNIDTFLAAGGEVIVTASAGCGANMKEYGELLKNDPAYAEPARRFSALTKDITEFLDELPLTPPTGPVARRVTYQDPCHLAHAQRITAAPRRLLQAIPGLELGEMEQSTMCCGGAGVYAMTQPATADKILAAKLDNIGQVGAEQVVTANPGCMLQLARGLAERNLPAANRPVVHIVDLLDEGYGGGE